jgi:hypothetical protein
VVDGVRGHVGRDLGHVEVGGDHGAVGHGELADDWPGTSGEREIGARGFDVAALQPSGGAHELEAAFTSTRTVGGENFLYGRQVAP